MDPKILTGLIFCLVYLFVIVSNRYVAAALWVGVVALFLVPFALGMEPIIRPEHLFELGPEGSWESINWNVIGIFAGMQLVAAVFIYSRVPAVMSDWLISKTPNVCWAILGVCALSSFISVFADNVATVLIVAPIAIELAKKLDVSPAPFLIGIAISSNLQGTATLIGDPPSMILAAQYKMNFAQFFVHHGHFGVFWAVQVGAVAGFAVLGFMFRKHRQPISEEPSAEVRSWVPVVLLVLMILGLAFGSVVDEDFLWFGGTVCLTGGTVAVLWTWQRDSDTAKRILKSYDWHTTCFLMGVFMMVFALTESGLIATAARWVHRVTGGSVLSTFILIVLFSMLLSAFVDNIPYLAAMLPLVVQLSQTLDLDNNMVLSY